jgi:NitT/TauT family transport system ATP-binding protein
MSALISLRGVRKSFANGVVALDGLDLDLRAGEFLSLVGPSGCGKSTALRLIAGLAAPDAGEIVWGGDAPGVGFVFQDPTLLPWASVFDNVRLPLRLAGMDKRASWDAVAQALVLVGLAPFGNSTPRELSGGMRMRVSIARALVQKPGLLLMDEPFAALDEIARFQLNDELLRLRQETGASVVFVTHSVFEAAYLSDRIAVMSARPGRLAAMIEVGAAERGPAFRASPDFTRACAAAADALRAGARENAA